jgi:D-xylose transport system ATP-binding protein
MSAPLVEMRGVSKHFGGVHAVENVSLTLAAGEVLGLLGHNGAGKSTLIRLLAGAHTLDAGEIYVGGERAHLRSPRDARDLGIETLYQDLALADNLDAAGNLFLGRELLKRFGALDLVAMERVAREVIRSVNPRFDDFRSPVQHLSGGERQSVAIARAVHFRARVLILDEPTAALGPAETRNVGQVIERLRTAGLGIVLVSHDLHDVFALSDRVVVMKAGGVLGIHETSELTQEQLLTMIVGGASASSEPPR